MQSLCFPSIGPDHQTEDQAPVLHLAETRSLNLSLHGDRLETAQAQNLHAGAILNLLVRTEVGQAAHNRTKLRKFSKISSSRKGGSLFIQATVLGTQGREISPKRMGTAGRAGTVVMTTDETPLAAQVKTEALENVFLFEYFYVY